MAAAASRQCVMWIEKLAIFLAVGCAALAVLAYLVQTRMVFPTHLVQAASNELPAAAVRFDIPTPDGERLAALRLPSAVQGGGSRTLILGFGGNAWNAEAMALLLHRLKPKWEFPRLCRGGSNSLAYQEVHRRDSRFVSRQAHERESHRRMTEPASRI